MDTPGVAKLAVIIEDDADVRRLLETVLTQSGFQTVLASNGAEGVEAVRLYQPALTTLDVSMPGMDGFETAKCIREFSSTYIIMLTALGDEIDVVQGFYSGADEYLVKPFRPREFRARVGTLLRRTSGQYDPAPAVAQHVSSVPMTRPAPVAQTAPSMPVPSAPAPAPQPVMAHAAPAPQPMMAEPVVAHHVMAQAAPAPQASTQFAPAPATQYHVTNGHGQTNGHAQNGYAQNGFAQNGFAQDGYPQNGYAQTNGHVQPMTGTLLAERPTQVDGGLPTVDAAPVADAWLMCNGLAVNTDVRIATADDVPIELTRTEFDLLASLVASGRRVRSKADLVLTLRGQDYVTTYLVSDADKRAVAVHMANLRRKIGDNSATPRWIETVRGVGYRITDDS